MKAGSRRYRVGLVTGMMMLALTLTACPSKKKAGPQSITGSTSSSTSQEVGQGSLDRFAETGEGARGGPLEDVYFAYDSFSLDERARSTLQRNADWLKANPGARVEVEGHCDERGTVEYNLALGAKRAKAARDYLVALGIEPSRISTISYGEELPICRETTESCYSRNRRDHLVVLR